MSEALLLQVIQELQGIGGRMDRVDEQFSQMASRMDRMDEQFSQMASRMDRMDEQFNQMASRMDRMDEQIALLSVHMERFEAKLDASFEQTANISENHLELTSQVDIMSEDNKSICQIIGEHEVSIRTLRRKAV